MIPEMNTWADETSFLVLFMPAPFGLTGKLLRIGESRTSAPV